MANLYLPAAGNPSGCGSDSKKYEELGYKIDESSGSDLWVSKIGQTLHLTFFIQNFMVGKLEVLF